MAMRRGFKNYPLLIFGKISMKTRTTQTFRFDAENIAFLNVSIPKQIAIERTGVKYTNQQLCTNVQAIR